MLASFLRIKPLRQHTLQLRTAGRMQQQSQVYPSYSGFLATSMPDIEIAIEWDEQLSSKKYIKLWKVQVTAVSSHCVRQLQTVFSGTIKEAEGDCGVQISPGNFILCCRWCEKLQMRAKPQAVTAL